MIISNQLKPGDIRGIVAPSDPIKIDVKENFSKGLNLLEGCLKHKLPEPEFEDTQTSFIVTINKSKLTEEFLEKIKLNERQKKAIKFLKEHKKITSKEYMEINKISERTARNDITNLVEKNILHRIGTTQSTYYMIKHSATRKDIK